jgi:hypothetical protein
MDGWAKIIEADGHFALSAEDNGATTSLVFNINYCPICGRELNRRAEAAEAERDACKADLKSMADWYRDSVCDDGICGWCKQDADHGLDGDANECAGFYKNDCFEWRGCTRSGAKHIEIEGVIPDGEDDK